MRQAGEQIAGAFESIDRSILPSLTSLLDNLLDSAALARPGVDADLHAPMGPIEPVLERVDPILRTSIHLNDDEFEQLVNFVRNGLLDPRARPEKLRKMIPKSVPSGFPVLTFQ